MALNKIGNRLKRVSKALWKGIKQFGSAMMEASRRYHEAQANQPEQRDSALKSFAEQKRKKLDGFDRRSI